MKYPPPFLRYISSGALILAALQFPLPANSSATGTPNASQAEADVKDCKAQLSRIFEAIQRFQARHGKLPELLSRLNPEFIADRETFMCPIVRRQDDFQSWKAGLRVEVFFDPYLSTSYSYEFSTNRLQLAPGVWSDYQVYKERQRKLLGDRVPIVRCFAHNPVLNLSIGGQVYTSGRYWENNYADLVDHDELAPDRLFADLLTGFLNEPRSFPPRPSNASPGMLDLTNSYNFRLNETLRFGASDGEDFGSLPRGVVQLEKAQVAYDVRGRIQLKGTKLRMPFPERVNGIQVRQACRQMYLLCGTVHNAPADTEIARIDVRYAEGPTEQFAIVYGRDVRNWWFDPQQPDPRMVWDGAIIGPESAGKRVRLYEMRWDNPRPDARIESLDFVSTLSPAAPFLIAITLQ